MTVQLHANKAFDAQDIERLVQDHQVHRDVYTSQDVYALEMQHLFANVWVFVGHESQTPKHGDYFTTQIGSQPVIQVRHSDGKCPSDSLQAFSSYICACSVEVALPLPTVLLVIGQPYCRLMTGCRQRSR